MTSASGAAGRPRGLTAHAPGRIAEAQIGETVSKFVSSEQGTALIHFTFRSHDAESGMVKLERPSRSVRCPSNGEASCA
jgi:hypothetical protein